MEVAFVSEFIDGRRLFRHVDVDVDGREAAVRVGGSDPLEDSFCQRVVDGRLPQLMPDAGRNAEALQLPATRSLPVGAHLSVPIRLSNGRIYGTFCCFSTVPDQSLNPRDLAIMQVFAEAFAEQVEAELARRDRQGAIEKRIDAVLHSAEPGIVYQPLYHLGDGRIVGFEALARFAVEPHRPPNEWFADAAGVGKGSDLQGKAIRASLPALERLPASVYLSINASPLLIVDGGLEGLLDGLPLDRLVVEVTEHEAVDKYGDLVAAVRPLQQRGLRLAIDDAGAGYASFRHILNLAPHLFKLDVSITRGIDADRSRRALAAAMCRFAIETDCRIVAEGVETAAELDTLRDLGFDEAQGYFLGRPLPLDPAIALCSRAAAGGDRH
jgi:EAL domain-containing protein (putative c-di-GMP-specific phosphodiesterase class I)